MRLRDVQFFPVTPFGAEGAVDAAMLNRHIEAGMEHDPGGVFVACGTGEFHALGADEVAVVVETGVRAVDGRRPVVAGTGGPLPHAIACARHAERAGAAGLLVLPPYLVTGPPSGFVAYVEQLAAATELPLILYQRDRIRLSPELAAELATHPQVVGLKDGSGDLDLVQRIVLAVRDRVGDDFQFFNGCPTAELTQAAYRAIGVPLYSSAIFCIAPEISKAFFSALERDDVRVRDELLSRFIRPLVELRDRVPGYAVSLIKAGVRDGGLDVGSVRPPLVDPAAEDLDELRRLLAVGRDLVSSSRTASGSSAGAR